MVGGLEYIKQKIRKMGFGVYEVENKEYGVWGFGFKGFKHNTR